MRRPAIRALGLSAAVGPLVAVALAVAPGGAAHATCALADSAHHVSLVIRHSDGEPSRAVCVGFDSNTATFDSNTHSITGEEIVRLAQVPIQTVDFGGQLGHALCQVDNEPPTPAGGFTRSNCFGSAPWVIWVSNSSGQWHGAGQGISNQRYADGDAEGLSRGTPAPDSPAGLCPPPQPWPAPSATSTPNGQAPSPRDSAIPAPTNHQPTPSTAPGSAPGAVIATSSPIPGSTPQAVQGSAVGGASSGGSSAARASRGSQPAVAPGWLAAAAGGAGLTAMLLIQLVLPRFRR